MMKNGGEFLTLRCIELVVGRTRRVLQTGTPERKKNLYCHKKKDNLNCSVCEYVSSGASVALAMMCPHYCVASATEQR